MTRAGALTVEGSARKVAEGELLWAPSADRIAAAPITAYMAWLKREHGLSLAGSPLDKSASRDAMKNPEAIDYFVRFADESIDYQWRPSAPEQKGRA